MGIRVRWPIDSCARFGSVGLRFLAFAWRHGDFYARVAIRRYVVGTIRLKKMPPTWAARLEEATMVDEAQLSKAVAALTAGKPVVFPTDTVYGIGIAVGLACSPEAIFIDKRRDPDKAIPWLVGSPVALTRYGRDVSQLAHDMVSQFWPGPLTLVVKAGDNVPEAFRGANDTIALRMPNDSVALELSGSPWQPRVRIFKERNRRKRWPMSIPNLRRRCPLCLATMFPAQASRRPSSIARMNIRIFCELGLLPPMILRNCCSAIPDVVAVTCAMSL